LGKSIKNKNRHQMRRRKQLRAQKGRELERQPVRQGEAAFSWKKLLAAHILELFFMGLLAAGIMGIMMLAPDRRSIKKMSDSVSVVVENQAPVWQKSYPFGYKVIAFTEKGIVHTSFDTFPEGFVFDWSSLVVAHIQANRLTNTDEKIQVVMENIDYMDVGVSGMTIDATFTRKKGMTNVLGHFGELELVAQIVEDTGGQIFCLFGLRR